MIDAVGGIVAVSGHAGDDKPAIATGDGFVCMFFVFVENDRLRPL